MNILPQQKNFSKESVFHFQAPDEWSYAAPAVVQRGGSLGKKIDHLNPLIIPGKRERGHPILFLSREKVRKNKSFKNNRF
jgi:hypothetical protein